MPLFNTVKNFVNSSTEIKVKDITDDRENSMSNGNAGTLMNEISVLTYSPKTLKEIISVLKKRLQVALYLTKRFSHKNCVIVVKTLTLISYLLNNGSDEFIEWLNSTSNYIFDHLRTVEIDERQINKTDMKIWLQIRNLSQNISLLLNDPNLLEKRRQNVIEFRSSISFPGRKSTDNSHLTRYSSERLSRNNSNMNTYGSKSLDVNRRQYDNSMMYTIADEGEEEEEEEEEEEREKEQEEEEEEESNNRFINFRLNRHRDVTVSHSKPTAKLLGNLREEANEDGTQTNGKSTGLTSRMFHVTNPFRS